MKSNGIRGALCTAALLAWGSTPVHAQFDMVNGLFEEVNAVTIYLQRGELSNAGRVTGDDLRGAGLEVLINLSSVGWAELELGLGASYLRGYGDSDPNLDLRTSVRALPTVSLYASRDVFEVPAGRLSGYIGGSFGLVELWNAQAYDLKGRAWTIEAQTFELGYSGGLYWTFPFGVGAFGELGYRNRTFPSAKWTLPDSASLDEEWRALDLSGTYAQLGIQLRVKEEKSDPNDAITPPAPAGVWILERVDGAALPATLASPASVLQHALLRLEPTDSTDYYTLEMSFRQAPAAVGAALPPPLETGSFTTRTEAGRKHILTFTPTGSGKAQTAERLAGRLYLSWNGHVLVFAPGNAPPPSK